MRRKYLPLSVGVHAGKKIADPEICGENNEESHKDINMVKTGEVVAVERHGVAIFRPGKELKDFVWDITDGEEE